MFDLNEAISRWRNRLAQGETCRASDLDELESHLREEIEHLAGSNLSQEETFSVATRRLGEPADLVSEFGKLNTGAVWSHRLFWMAAGLLAYFVLNYFTRAASQACVLIAAAGGLGGYSLGVVNVAAGLFIFVAALSLAHRAFRQDVYRARFGRLVTTRARRVVLYSGLVALVLGLNAAQIYVRGKTAQIASAQDFAAMAIVSAYASLILSVILPVLLVLLVIKLHPFKRRQIEA